MLTYHKKLDVLHENGKILLMRKEKQTQKPFDHNT